MSLIKNYLIKGCKGGVIPLAFFLVILGGFFFFGTVGYHIFPTETLEGRIVKLTKDAKSNCMYEVTYEVNDEQYSTFIYCKGDKIEVGQSCNVKYYISFPSFSKVVE